MRLLAIDAGNTRVKWALHENGVWGPQGWEPTADSERLAAALCTVPAPTHIIVANVAGERVARAVAQAAGHHHAEITWVTACTGQCGVRSGYAVPAQLGADRWAALIGVRARYAAACVVVNAGTTVTVDALSSDGLFLGGCIVPGAELMQDALARGTAQLTRGIGKFLYFPDNTADAIVSGAVNALAGAIDRMLGFMREAGEDEPFVALSGGAAEMLAPHLQGRVERIDNLVLEGLLRIASD